MPLELRKIPKFKRQMIRRQMRVASARMDQVQTTAVFSMRSIIAGSIDATKSNIVVLSPQTRCGVLETAMPLQVDLGITRTAENRIDMA